MSFPSSIHPANPTVPQRATPSSRFARLQGRRFWALPLGLLVAFAAYVVLLETSPASPITQRQVISESGQIISLLFVMSLCWRASAQTPPGRARWAWRCFGLAFATYTVAETIFGYEGIVIFAGQSTPTPTLADAFYLPFYPLMATGLLLLPAARLTESSRVRAIVEACITAGALLGLGLIYLISPYFQGGTPPFTLAVLVAYPIGDSILIVALILLVTRGVEPNYRPIFFWLIAGLLSFIYADVAFDYWSLQNTYAVGAINVDPFWALGELTMSLAPLSYLVYGNQANPTWGWLKRLALSAPTSSLVASVQRSLLPYVSVIVLVGLLVVNQPPMRGGGLYSALEALTLVVVLLIIVRQILIGRDLVDAQVANARARQLDDLKNQFITSVNHELRTPLMTMQAYIELLRTRHEDIVVMDRGRLIEEVGQTSDALVDLVQSILEVRQVDQGAADSARETVQIQPALDKAIALINPREGRMVERVLRVHAPYGLAILGDATHLQQILTNLLSNAIKYSAPGTEIEVTAEWAGPSKVAHGRRRGGRPMVEIVVRDQGLGIPPDEAPLLFNRFVRLPRDLASKVVGSGLGLYLCRTLAEAMEGQIWVESSGVPGEGSAFHVLLPAAQAEARTAAQARPPMQLAR